MPKLFLIPNSIADENIVFEDTILNQLSRVFLIFAEDQKAARRLIKRIFPHADLSQYELHDLNEHTPNQTIQDYAVMLKNQDAAVVSEAGCPCVADPGSDLVLFAHELGVEVMPCVGPSSILLALMSSGLSGQNFAFVGYMPKDEKIRRERIRLLLARSKTEQQSQIFMETPYRTMSMYDELMRILPPDCKLCVAIDIYGSEQSIKTLRVEQWQKQNLSLPKKPALFIIQNF